MKQDELKEIINPSLTDRKKNLPLHLQERLLHFQVSPNLYKTLYSELCNWKKDADLIRDLSDFPDFH